MKTDFKKYQGTGNDFIILNNFEGNLPALSKEQIARLCHRRFGIGSDGLIILEKAEQYDFRMIYYNADGSESTMCGNGGRCLVKYAYDLGLISEKVLFVAVDGPHTALVKEDIIHLGMLDVYDIEKSVENSFLNTGSPHYVEKVTEINSIDVFKRGKKIRYSEKFSPGGTNVNFMELLPSNTIEVRTYERGVEDETYSCGTGVTACAVVSYYDGYISPVKIITKGGELEVSFTATHDDIFENVFLIGPAVKVFEGQVEI